MVNRSRTVGLAALLFACWFLAMPAAGDIAFPNGLLFSIQRSGEPPSYLFGTMHSDDPRVINLPAEVESRFVASRMLLLEVELDPEAVLQSITMMMSKDPQDLQLLLDESLYQRCVAAAGRIGIPEATLPFFKPWALATLLSLPSIGSGEFLDLALHNRAMEGGKPVAGLESVSEQIGSLDRLSPADQFAMLEDVLNNLDRLPMIYQELLDAYLNRDLGALVRISREGFEADGEGRLGRFEESVIFARNRRMAERLQQHHEAGGGLFAAVGALHLPGEQGMLSLLETMGYRVEPVY